MSFVFDIKSLSYSIFLNDRAQRIICKLIHGNKGVFCFGSFDRKFPSPKEFINGEENTYLNLSDFGGNELTAVKVIRELYGIVGVYDVYAMRSGRLVYDGFFIPDENKDALKKTLSCSGRGVFCKTLNMSDLEVLSVVHQRDSDLKKSRGIYWNPRIHPHWIARRLGRSIDDPKLSDSLDRLVGLLSCADKTEHGSKTIGEKVDDHLPLPVLEPVFDAVSDDDWFDFSPLPATSKRNHQHYIFSVRQYFIPSSRKQQISKILDAF